MQVLLALERRFRVTAKYLANVPSALRSNKAVFGQIYADNRWGNEESVSGDGSTLDETEFLRNSLAKLVRDLDVRSVLDVPCGDFNWMKLVDLNDAEYIGVDVVPDLVAQNKERFGSEKYRFICADAEVDALPYADLVMCRDLMVHLPNRSALRLVCNLRNTGARYFLATTFPETESNLGIFRGMWRPLNLERPPFSFPPPLQMLVENSNRPGRGDKSLGLWRLQDLDLGAAST